MSKTTNNPEPFPGRGLILVGKVIKRTRQYFEKAETYRHMYSVEADNGKEFTLFVWGDHTPHQIDTEIAVSVHVRPYADKHGVLRYNLEVPSERRSSKEEDF